jgi:hypothetical protein
MRTLAQRAVASAARGASEAQAERSVLGGNAPPAERSAAARVTPSERSEVGLAGDASSIVR